MEGGLGNASDSRVDVRKAGTGEKRQGREAAQVALMSSRTQMFPTSDSLPATPASPPTPVTG